MVTTIRQLFLISLIAGLFACNSSVPKTSKEIPSRSTQADTTDGTLFVVIIDGLATKESIELTKDDLAIVDQQIKRAVSDYNREEENVFKKIKLEDPTRTIRREDYIIDLRNYKRQYVANINTKKQKEVWVNCFCSTEGKDYWKSKVVSVRDGGVCYFNLKIIIDQKSYYEFMVNSRA